MDPVRHDDTSLKWGTDGELSPVDQQRILARLSAQDPTAQGLLDCPWEDQAGARGSIS